MGVEEKVDQVLAAVKEEHQLNESRFGELTSRMQEEHELNESHFNQLSSRMQEEHELNESHFNQLSSRMQQEHQLNDARFSQVSSGLIELRGQMGQLEKNLTAKIDQVFETLSQDIQAIGQDQGRLKNRVDRLEKKVASL